MDDERYNRLEDKMDKLFDKLDNAHMKVDEKLDRIEIAVTKNTQTIKIQQKQLDDHEKKLTPVYNRYQQLIGASKVVGGAVVAFGVLEGLLKLFL